MFTHCLVKYRVSVLNKHWYALIVVRSSLLIRKIWKVNCLFQVNEITYILNVSTTCIKPANISDGHFLRIPVNDNYSAKLTPHFEQAFQFLGMSYYMHVIYSIIIMHLMSLLYWCFKANQSLNCATVTFSVQFFCVAFKKATYRGYFWRLRRWHRLKLVRSISQSL
jgi:hypothetical protein